MYTRLTHFPLTAVLCLMGKVRKSCTLSFRSDYPLPQAVCEFVSHKTKHERHNTRLKTNPVTRSWMACTDGLYDYTGNIFGRKKARTHIGFCGDFTDAFLRCIVRAWRL